MRTRRGLAIVTMPVLGVSILAGGCNAPQAAPRPSQPAASAQTPVGTVKDIMKGIVDANSAAIWDAVGTEETPRGTVEKAPTTDEEWTKLEYNAIVLAEVANLLKTPGRKVARAEEANATSQPGAPELTPAQIDEKVNKDRAAWNGKVDAFQATAVKAIAAARSHSKDAILEVGSDIDSACEGCHKVYWYPDEKIPDVGATKK